MRKIDWDQPANPILTMMLGILMGISLAFVAMNDTKKKEQTHTIPVVCPEPYTNSRGQTICIITLPDSVYHK